MDRVIDTSKWEWPGFYAACPICGDEILYISVRPVWATDTSEIYEYWCPVHGVVDTYVEHVDNEDMDRWHAPEDAVSRVRWI